MAGILAKIHEWYEEQKIRDWRNITKKDLELAFSRPKRTDLYVSKEFYEYLERCGLIDPPIFKQKKKQKIVKHKPTKEERNISAIVEILKSSFTHKHIYVFAYFNFNVCEFRNTRKKLIEIIYADLFERHRYLMFKMRKYGIRCLHPDDVRLLRTIGRLMYKVEKNGVRK